MEKLFLSVLNMSLVASVVIAAIMLARRLLKRAPKIISYALWAVAGFRLIFPFTLESIFSLMPIKSAPIPQNIALQSVPRIDSGIRAIDNAVSAALPAAPPIASANPLQTWIFIGSCVWLLGVAVMLIYSVVSIVLLKRGLRGAAHIEGRLYEAGNLRTPFVIGLFRPRIYIPAELSEEERRYIILHEQTHIRRRDHTVKMLAYLVLCLHWFNPLAWAAFILMGADMEMSCDERVMKELGGDIKNAYSLTLVRVAAGRKILNGSPLAFGEGGMKERVKNVLNFKKRSRVIVTLAVALAAMLTVGFAVSRADADEGFSAETAVEQLANSIKYTDEAIRFQIPADYLSSEAWNIYISGRAEFEDGFSMSVHELEDVNNNHAWEPGKWYTIPLEGRYLTEFAMDIYLTDKGGDILEKRVDLLAIIPSVSGPETGALTVALYRPYTNADNIEGAIRMYPEADTGWTIIPGTISVTVFVPDGTIALRTYYAEAGTGATAHIMLDTKYSVPFINARDASSLVSERYRSSKLSGNTWRVAESYPDGFLGHIWAVTVDANGVEHMSDFMNVIYEPDAQPASDTEEAHQATGVFVWPLSDSYRDNYTVVQTFGTRVHPIYDIIVSHDGIDIVAPGGSPILAADAGAVIEISKNDTDGYFIWLDHGNGYQTFYAQMRGFAEGLENGDSVKRGDVIGYVGSSGAATGTHLHFGVQTDGGYVNPLEFYSPPDEQSAPEAQHIGTTAIPLQGGIYAPDPMPELVAVDLTGKEILEAFTLADGTELRWYIDGEYISCAYRKPGGDWICFLGGEALHYRDDVGFGTYAELFGHSGFYIELTRGAAYHAYDYYYFDTQGNLKPLVQSAWVNTIGDFNGDGKNELLMFYHGGRDTYYYYMRDGVIYESDVTQALREQFPELDISELTPLPDNLYDGGFLIVYRIPGDEDTLLYARLELTPDAIVVTANNA